MTTWTRRPWAVTLTAAACYRATRFITQDAFPPMARARLAAAERLTRRSPAWGELPDCPWCVGLWVALAASAATELADRRGRLDLALALAAPLAISAVVGAVSDREIH